MARLSDLLGGGGGGGVPLAATAFAKPSIILFDTRPGTRTWTVPQGVTQIRAFVVGAGGSAGVNSPSGAGGGYSEKVYSVTPGAEIDYTVGAVPGGTSSFAGPGGTITATGGDDGDASGAAGGVGSGGDINTSGGGGSTVNTIGGGGSSGHRFGDGIAAVGHGGGGWSADFSGSSTAAAPSGKGSGGVDGFGLGILPGAQRQWSNSGSTLGDKSDFTGYGCGGSGDGTLSNGSNGGIGGGGSSGGGAGGIGGGGGRAGPGGFGLVGVEWIE